MIPDPNLFLTSNEVVPTASEPNESLTLAGQEDVALFDTGVEVGHENAFLRSVASVIYFRRHVLTDADIRTLIAPARHQTRSANYELDRQRCMSWQAKFQNAIMAWFMSGVRSTCEAMGGVEFFETSTVGERRRMWSAIYKQAPKEMALQSLATVGQSVPIAEIYSGASPAHIKWQRFLKTSFVWAAEDTFRFRYMEDRKTECFKNWRAGPSTPAMAELELGGILEVPVKVGGVWHGGD